MLRLGVLLPLLMALLLGIPPARGETGRPAFAIDGKVALNSLVALSDMHLVKLADALETLAATPEAQSGNWERIKPLLAKAGRENVPALNWYALPDGTYWSIQEGKAAGNLSDRAYFPRTLAGKTVFGELVVSKATGKNVAIVAVPVVRPDKTVVGVLGSSVYLDQLSARLEKEMGLDKTMIFYSFNAAPLIGLDWDSHLIFSDPTKLSPDLGRAIDRMLAQEEGATSYSFRGRKRTVLFRKSALTGWWYVFGIIPEGRETKQAPRQKPGERQNRTR